MSTSPAFPFLASVVLGFALLSPSKVEANSSQIFDYDVAPTLRELSDRPHGAYLGTQSRAAGDTLCFGDVDGDGFAIPGGVWTFDGLQGWEAIDVTAQTATHSRQITAAAWDADPYNDVPAPVLAGTGSAWFGVFGTEARELCWDFGIGYGNDWCQRLVGPTLTYSGAGDVSVSWTHFNETEEEFDYTRVYLELLPSETRVDLREYTGLIGLAADHPTSPPPGISDSDILVEADFQGETQYRIVFEVTSDGSWSDEDGFYTTSYGAAGFDEVQIGANSYDFDADLQGWTPDVCPPVGTFLGVEALSSYVIEDACECKLDGMVLEMHAGTPGDGYHPYGQHIYAISPPVDMLNDVPSTLPGGSLLDIHVDWDQYSQMPRANGVFYRPGALYFPYTCEVTGEVVWSDRVGQSTYFFVGEDPVCSANRANLSATDVPVPSDAEQVRFVFELYASCDAFGIPPDQCTGMTNFTPIIDNVRICFTRNPDAPSIAVDNGLRFQDGFSQGDLNWPDIPGRADVTRNLNFANTAPIILMDSLMVGGPVVTTAENAWESHLWFRVARRGYGAGDRYFEWRDQANTATGVDIEAGEFAYASMDSCQQGTNAFKNKFASYFREDDDDFDPAFPELSDANEIIGDDVLFPGTKVEYFISSNYLIEPSQRYLLPDTTGGYFEEFEILPSWRDDEGVWKYPCFLQIDAYNRARDELLEDALQMAGIECDRFDYRDACTCWVTPMNRMLDPNNTNGMALPQLLGYRGVMVHGGLGALFYPEDHQLFSDYLTAGICGTDRRGLILDGPRESWAYSGASLFTNQLGAEWVSGEYNLFAGDENYCVQLDAPSGGGEAYGLSHSGGTYSYGAFGNGCPTPHDFHVLAPVGTGVGNRVYVNETNGMETEFAQIVNEGVSPNNYRTVLDGTAWELLAGQGANGECLVDYASRVGAISNELRAAVEWIYGVEDVPSLCVDPCVGDLTEIEPGGFLPAVATRLEPGMPNPFHPRTTLRYSLGSPGPVDLAIFDVSGRRVRTLASGELSAGAHEVAWDGTDESGRRVASGTYWARLEAAGRRSASRLVVLK